ncbi:MAG TPA: GNAT family N-acetyltransferase [Tepidisphaeraceae bacterium]|nr:GNAT family N-acetyltransferase [Tepidisphaeraceae bacterium]
MQPTGVHLRAGTVADADDLVRVHFAAVHGTASTAYPSAVLHSWAVAPDDARRRAATRQAIERGDELFVVATLDGVVCGFGSIVPASGELRAVYVDPDFGGRGVGLALLRRLEEMASDHGMSELHMHASINAERFYVKHGYRVVRRGVHRLAGGIEMPCVTMSKGITRQCSGPEPRV